MQLGIFDESDAEAGRQERAADKRQLAELLFADGLLDSPEPPINPPTLAVSRLIARGRSELVGLQWDDIAGVEEQQNVPGVSDGAPNWRRRLPLTIAEFAAPGGPLDSFAAAMAAEGRAFNASTTSRSADDQAAD